MLTTRGGATVRVMEGSDEKFERPLTHPARRGYVDMSRLLEGETIVFGKPVVLVHGDGHYFLVDKPLPGSRPVENQAVPTLRNFTRVETFGPADQ